MLRWPRSLALRAVAALLAVHFLTITLSLGLGVLEGRTTRPGGADVALELAVNELRLVGDRPSLPPDGAFASLAGRNPSLWLIVQGEDRSLVVGSPPPVALRLFGIAGAGAPGNTAGDGLGVLLSDAVVEQDDIAGHPVLVAAGGVDPDTITSMDVLQTFHLAPAIAVFGGLGLLGAIALLVAIPLLSRAIRPIVEEATSIHPQDVGRRLDEDRAPIELLPLARAFNGALDRLEVELGRRKRLISNVAHELRTPLAVLSLRVDTLVCPDHEREGLRTAVDRVTRLVEQMLDLERLSLPSGPRVAVNLTELTQEVISSLAPLAVDAGYDLSLEAPEAPVIVSGERQAVERAVTNLVRNAILHGGGRGVISVVLGEGWLEVADEGPGVPPDLEPRLFDAFARGPGEALGSGLGLHLTREIMRGLGGEVQWRRDASRTIFRLRFPTSGIPLDAGSSSS
ncbi:MAG TPA: HAMP domain-containing sensor histidine kinase [Caulobacter sp.]|nr:HAMP domain-containing sensor histidine kinase [Caulobacter sp.]